MSAALCSHRMVTTIHICVKGEEKNCDKFIHGEKMMNMLVEPA